MQPAAAFAGESLREAQLASTRGGALLKDLGFAFPIGIVLSEMLRLPYRYRKVSDASRDRDSGQVGCGDGIELAEMLRVA